MHFASAVRAAQLQTRIIRRRAKIAEIDECQSMRRVERSVLRCGSMGVNPIFAKRLCWRWRPPWRPQNGSPAYPAAGHVPVRGGVQYVFGGWTQTQATCDGRTGVSVSCSRSSALSSGGLAAYAPGEPPQCTRTCDSRVDSLPLTRARPQNNYMLATRTPWSRSFGAFET